MVHLDGLDFSGQLARSEGNDHTGLDDTSLDSADGHCTNTADLVDVLEGQTESLVGRARRWQDSIQSFKQGLALKIKIIKSCAERISKANNLPSALPSLRSTAHPLYQGRLEEASIMLSPWKPEMGTKGTATGL